MKNEEEKEWKTQTLKPAVMMSVVTISIECKISELPEVIEEIESHKNFYQWFSPPLEQLDRVIGSLADPKIDRIPLTTLQYYSSVIMMPSN